MELYNYRCTVVKVVDADTLWIEVDLGFDVRMKVSVRLNGIDAFELSTPEGRVAKALVEALVAGGPLFVRTIKDRKEKYGRYLAEILLPGGELLTDALLEGGHAVRYAGGKR